MCYFTDEVSGAARRWEPGRSCFLPIREQRRADALLSGLVDHGTAAATMLESMVHVQRANMADRNREGITSLIDNVDARGIPSVVADRLTSHGG